MSLPTEIIIQIKEHEDVQQAIIEAMAVADHAGFELNDQSLFGTVISELATNIIRYAGTGEIYLTWETYAGNSLVKVKAVDKGPGIENVEMAMKDNYSSRKNSLGMGLPSVVRIMDEVDIDSNKNRGTTIIAIKRKCNNAY